VRPRGLGIVASCEMALLFGSRRNRFDRGIAARRRSTSCDRHVVRDVRLIVAGWVATSIEAAERRAGMFAGRTALLSTFHSTTPMIRKGGVSRKGGEEKGTRLTDAAQCRFREACSFAGGRPRRQRGPLVASSLKVPSRLFPGSCSLRQPRLARSPSRGAPCFPSCCARRPSPHRRRRSSQRDRAGTVPIVCN
jgi:hypothetical protein